MKWVTRQRPKVDRIACPWLIRRFIDPDADILYVPADDVLTVAERAATRSTPRVPPTATAASPTAGSGAPSKPSSTSTVWTATRR